MDAAGATSDPRVWAVGNVLNPMATVPVSLGMGAMAGGHLNMALVTAEFDTAELDAAEFDAAEAATTQR